MKRQVNTFILMTIGLLLSAQQNIKKIEIVNSNNPFLNKRINLVVASDPTTSAEYTKLKDYVIKEAGLKSPAENELDFFCKTMSGVNSQWSHNGWMSGDSLTSYQILLNAKNGEKYRCVEYGRVLNDVLLSFGHMSRVISLKNSNSAYGGAEMGHVAIEVWSNELKKWVFLDPQFNVYLLYNGSALNFYEIYKAKQGGKFTQIKVINGNGTENNNDYKTFIERYFGYISIKLTDNTLQYELALKLEGKEDYVTFQSLPWGKTIFTDNYKDFYFDINQTMIIIDYAKDEFERTNNELRKCVIKSVEDFNKSMPLFAAKPNLTLSFDNNMVGFDKYEVTINNQKFIVKDKLDVELKPGNNNLTATCINKAGVKGVATTLLIKYE